MAVVLIVEDEAEVRVLAGSILQEAGHETRCAGTTAEALAILKSDERIDLLFVDMNLLDGHEAGLELAQAAAEARPGLPAIYTTGRGITDGMVALFVQPNGFLGKPYTGEQLLTAVSNLLTQSSWDRHASVC
jgi:DNA-binding NtrC family response regulator